MEDTNGIKAAWPFSAQTAEVQPICFIEPKYFLESDMRRDGIVAVSDSWRDGAIAAVLRGGINAQATLYLLSWSGITALKLFHIEERIRELEEVFLSSVVIPAQTRFESVDVTWRRDPSIIELLKSIGGSYSMLFLGAPLAASEIMPMYEKGVMPYF